MDQIDEEMDIVVFEDEDGNEVELEVLFTFEHGDGVYALLQDVEPAEEEEGISGYIFEIVGEGEDEEFITVDDEKLKELTGVVEEILAEELEEAEEE